MEPKELPQTVHIARSVEPATPVISEETKLKNMRSRQAYPELNLSDGEYVVATVKRHIIGLFAPLAIGLLLVATALFLLLNVEVISRVLSVDGTVVEPSMVSVVLILFVAMVAIVTYFFYDIYKKNKFFLTNEVIVQQIQTGPFSRREQSISLSNVEDASYTKTGIIQHMFDFGSIRLSTIGDENTYRFSYVANPEHQIDVLNNAVESFKNGRRVE